MRPNQKTEGDKVVFSLIGNRLCPLQNKMKMVDLGTSIKTKSSFKNGELALAKCYLNHSLNCLCHYWTKANESREKCFCYWKQNFVTLETKSPLLIYRVIKWGQKEREASYPPVVGYLWAKGHLPKQGCLVTSHLHPPHRTCFVLHSLGNC